MIGYIYNIINTVNEKRYVGKTIDLNKRLSKHYTELRGQYHHSHKLQRAFNKYGEQAFKVEYKEYNIQSENELNELEIATIEKYDSYYNGYNETFGGDGNSTKFDFKETVLIYQLGQRYRGIIHKLANYYNCDRTTINAIIKRESLKNVEYNESELKKLISKIGIGEKNLIENYQDNYSKQLSKSQVLGILSTLELRHFTQSACAEACGVKKDVIGCIVRGRTYKAEVEEFEKLSQEEKQQYCDLFCAKYNVEQIHYKNKRSTTKNPLTQEQVDYILDNIKNTTAVQIATDLKISVDRVRGVKNKKSYLDLIHNYEDRHSSISQCLPV